MTDRDYYLWLSSITNLEIDVKRKLLNCFENPYEVYHLKEEMLRKYGFSELVIGKFLENKTRSLDLIKDALYKKNIKFTAYIDNDYPENLKNIYDPPVGLYYIGKLPEPKPTVAIIGARCCSDYGREITHNFSRNLAKCGVNIVSGLALGIDGHAHEGALEGNGYTLGILGSSIDSIYPSYNFALFEKMYKRGCVMSEYYVGAKALKTHFPERNRLISAFSDLVLVVEAKLKSGTMITVDRALEQGKEVYVIPGRIGDKLSEGCLKLASQGANIATCYEDILQFLEDKYCPANASLDKDSQYSFKFSKDDKNELSMSENEMLIYSKLSLMPIHFNELVATCDLNYYEAIDALSKLSLKQLIKHLPGEYYILSD